MRELGFTHSGPAAPKEGSYGTFPQLTFIHQSDSDPTTRYHLRCMKIGESLVMVSQRSVGASQSKTTRSSFSAAAFARCDGSCPKTWTYRYTALRRRIMAQVLPHLRP